VAKFRSVPHRISVDFSGCPALQSSADAGVIDSWQGFRLRFETKGVNWNTKRTTTATPGLCQLWDAHDQGYSL